MWVIFNPNTDTYYCGIGRRFINWDDDRDRANQFSNKIYALGVSDTINKLLGMSTIVKIIEIDNG